jgi:GrpB-like predicted nucleotidyltransferase (UPF0157 family)
VPDVDEVTEDATAATAGPATERPTVVPYDPAWQRRGAELTGWLAGLVVPGLTRVEHIGSTAIPGMAAKDVLDVQLSVHDLEMAATALDPVLGARGFVRRPYEHDHVPAGVDDDVDRWAKRVWARRGHPDGDVNLHVRRVGSPGERLALLFRDWFRHHPEAVPAYAAFKRALAAEVDDIGPYSDLKGPVVDLVMVVAERWAEGTAWSP